MASSTTKSAVTAGRRSRTNSFHRGGAESTPPPLKRSRETSKERFRQPEPRSEPKDDDVDLSDDDRDDEGSIVQNQRQLQSSLSDDDDQPTQRPSMAKGGRRVAGGKKAPVLSILLNQIFWCISRKPSAGQMQHLRSILEMARDRNLVEFENFELIRAWFRNKRFHMRQAMHSFLTDIDHDQDDAIKMFDVIANCFETENLLKQSDLLDEDDCLIPFQTRGSQRAAKRPRYDDGAVRKLWNK